MHSPWYESHVLFARCLSVDDKRTNYNVGNLNYKKIDLLTSVAALHVLVLVRGTQSCRRGQVFRITIVDIHTNSAHHGTSSV